MQLMNRKGVYNTGTIQIFDVVVQVLEIPYKNNDMSFIILLPEDNSPESLIQVMYVLSAMITFKGIFSL